MDNINNKFLVLLLAEDNFEEEFRSFSEEDQQGFIDFWADLQAAVLRQLKEMPLEMQIQALLFQSVCIVTGKPIELLKLVGIRIHLPTSTPYCLVYPRHKTTIAKWFSY